MRNEEREALNALPSTPLDPTRNEADHFYICPRCGQAVDARRFGDVMWHDQDQHERLPTQ